MPPKIYFFGTDYSELKMLEKQQVQEDVSELHFSIQ